ncbi:SLC13 family permease [Virgibacillus halodenitrificans]|uniref:SLC13 family permease n=1 Tax=Virgibacillus halodenitrificans TaxID=1482 RepID=UPI001FB1A3E7|nr:SLC13 family permease [Virgibacillus halodenitrificans]MCJ0930630.1 anion permease [Virgibacillus halodenitrificans]MEC2160790.1 SLC13 family permease [Virgibacillus halodenitrificans]
MGEAAEQTARDRKLLLLKYLIVIIPPLIIYLIPTTQTFTQDMKVFFIITLVAILLWALELINLIVVALALPVAFILSGVATAGDVYAPWSQDLPYLVLGALILSAVFEESGLMKRLAYWFILRGGGSYKGIIYALSTSGFIVAFLVPGSLARIALYAGMAFGIIKALGLKKFSKGSVGLLFGAYNAAVTASFVSLTGVEPMLVFNSQLESIGMEGASWLQYALHNVPITIIWTYVMAFMITKIFKNEEEVEGKSYFQQQYQALGKLSMSEKKVTIILIVLVALLATSSIHGIALGWIFIGMTFICFLPGINLADDNTMAKTNFGMIFFITATMAIGQVSAVVGAGKFISESLFPLMTIGGTTFTVIATWVLSVVVNFVLTPFAASATMAIPLAELSQSLDISPLPLAYSFSHGLYQLLLPYESTLPLLLFSYMAMTYKQFLKYFSIQMVLNVAFIALIAIPYWYLIGLL